MKKKGDYEGARAMFHKVLRSLDDGFGPDPDDVSHAAWRLGSALHDAGDLHGAEKLYWYALHAVEHRRERERRLEFATRAAQLGRLLREKGDLAESKRQLHHALTAAEQVLGPEHEDTGNIAWQLGRTLSIRGEMREAAAMLQRSVEIAEKINGTEHPTVMQRMVDLNAAKRALAFDQL